MYTNININFILLFTIFSNTTQSVNIDQQDIQSSLLLGDFKRRCYDGNGTELLHK